MDLISKGKFQFNTEEALKTGLYVSGAPGSGKSDIVMMCIDRLRSAKNVPLPDTTRVIQGDHIHCVIFDPSQDWMSRYPASHVTTLKVDSGQSYLENIHLNGVEIIDCSNLTILQIQQLAELFSKALYKAQSKIPKEKRNVYFIIFEEAQTEFPQGALRAKRFQNVVRILTQGRNYFLRVGMVTQFAAMLDKDAVKWAKQRYFGWTDEKNDRNYIANFIGDEAAEGLKYFKSGDFLYYWPSSNILEKFHISPYKAKS